MAFHSARGQGVVCGNRAACSLAAVLSARLPRRFALDRPLPMRYTCPSHAAALLRLLRECWRLESAPQARFL